MRSYEAALAAAEDRPAFSNGMESECWFDNWCYRCAVDAPFQRGEANEGCPLVMVALLGKTPAEWIDRDSGNLGNQFHCTEYRPIDEGGADESPPESPPDPAEFPGQLDLLTASALDGFEELLSRQSERVEVSRRRRKP